ncbi:MAG: hypothetical protein ACE5KX_09310, partial [Acidimicrobiia bacterium]
MLEVEVGEVIEEQLTTLTDSVRSGLRQARIGYTGLGTEGTSVVFQVRDLTELERTREVVEEIAGGFGGGIGLVRGIVTSAGREVEATVSDDGGAILALTEESIRNRQQRAIEQSIEIVRRRIDETGTREPTIQRQGADRILVQLPGVGDPERVKRLLGKTAKLTFHLLDPTTTVAQARQGQLPPGSVLLPGDDVGAAGQPIEYVVRRRVEVGGDRLIDAQPTFDQNNQAVVSFRFDTVGGRKFGDATKENVGRRLAIVLDGRVISAPVIREPILGGSGQISGNFTVSSPGTLRFNAATATPAHTVTGMVSGNGTVEYAVSGSGAGGMVNHSGTHNITGTTIISGSGTGATTFDSTATSPSYTKWYQQQDMRPSYS